MAKRKRRSKGIVGAVLAGLLLVGGTALLGYASEGFTNWDQTAMAERLRPTKEEPVNSEEVVDETGVTETTGVDEQAEPEPSI